MAQPSVQSSSPVDNATDVFLNKPLTVTFGVALLASSVKDTSVVLLNVATDEIVAKNLVYNETTQVLTITPLSVLEESTVYVIRFPGTDIAISSSFAIADSSNEVLTTTITLTFTTGLRLFIDDSSIDKDATNLSLEGDLNLPVHIKALGNFAVATTLPKNNACDISTSIDGQNRIQVKFTKPLSGSLCSDDWLTVTTFPLLDMDQYLASGTTLGAGTIPGLTGVSCSGQYVYATFSGEVPKNVGIQVEIGETVTATDGSEFGPSNYLLQFATDRYPKVSGVHMIKREIKAAADELVDDYICAMLLKNTIALLTRYAAFDATAPSFSAIKWIVNMTIVDILDDQELEKALVAGTRRQLGDLNVSIDAVIGKLALKHARALKAVEDADKTLFGNKLLVQKIDNAKVSNYYDRPDRLWHGVNGKLVSERFKTYQPDIPAANSDLNRAAKVKPK